MSEKIVYTPEDLDDFDFENDLGNPGQYPFTRGIHSDMYRGRLWTMRQFAGFGSAEETNKRYKYLREQGQTGLSVAFHLPTLNGLDSDHPLCLGEVGRTGVTVDSLKDMEILFDGIPLDEVSTSMTINSTAIIALAMYIAVGEKQGVSQDKLKGTLQNDILKEYIAQNTYIFPPQPSIRLIVDIMEYCLEHIPQWNTISVSGYHIREAGTTAVQELAFTLADGIAYVQAALERGLDIDTFAPRISFFFDFHNNFFEEIAKLRAARRMWAKIMKEKFGAKKERSWQMKFHTQTAGCTLTDQQPLNNIVRVTLQALGAVLAGTQSLHTNSYDEQLCLPTQEAVTVALRTQQIIAYETGVPQVVDPLGGSYLIESLTNELEKKANEYLKKIEKLGGMVSAIKAGFPQSEISRSSTEYQRALEKGEVVVVGVNKFVTDASSQPLLKIDPKLESKQIKRLQRLRASRSNKKVKKALANLEQAASGNDNLLPPILRAVKAYATVGEISDVLRGVFGEYHPG